MSIGENVSRGTAFGAVITLCELVREKRKYDLTIILSILIAKQKEAISF